MAGSKAALRSLSEKNPVLAAVVQAAAKMYTQSVWLNDAGLTNDTRLKAEYGQAIYGGDSVRTGSLMFAPNGQYTPWNLGDMKADDSSFTAFVHTHPWWNEGNNSNFSGLVGDITASLNTGVDIYVVGVGGQLQVFSPQGRSAGDSEMMAILNASYARAYGNLDDQAMKALEDIGVAKGCK